MHVGIANSRWRGKGSRHSWRMRNPQFYVSGKRPMKLAIKNGEKLPMINTFWSVVPVGGMVSSGEARTWRDIIDLICTSVIRLYKTDWSYHCWKKGTKCLRLMCWLPTGSIAKEIFIKRSYMHYRTSMATVDEYLLFWTLYQISCNASSFLHILWNSKKFILSVEKTYPFKSEYAGLIILIIIFTTNPRCWQMCDEYILARSHSETATS